MAISVGEGVAGAVGPLKLVEIHLILAIFLKEQGTPRTFYIALKIALDAHRLNHRLKLLSWFLLSDCWGYVHQKFNQPEPCMI